MKLNFPKEQRNWIITGAAVAAFIVLLLNFKDITGAVRKLLSLFTPFYIGFVLSYLLNPLLIFTEEKILQKIQKFKTRRTLSLAMTYALFLALSVGIFVYFLPRFFLSVTTLAGEIPRYYDSLLKSTTDMLENRPEIYNLYLRYSEPIREVGGKILYLLSDHFKSMLPKIADTTLRIGGALLNGLIGIVISIYFLADKEKLIAQSKKVLNVVFKKEEQYQRLLTVGRITHQKTLHYITARLLDSLIVAVVTYLFMLIFSVPYALLSALSVGVFNTIPYFGSWLGAIPPALIVLVTRPTLLIPYLIFALLLEQLDGNVIGPKIQGKHLGLSPLWIIFAVFLFGGLFGFIGMVAGVPLFAVVYYFIHAAVNNGLAHQGKSTETADYAPPEDRELLH